MAEEKKEKPPKRLGYVLVSIPDFPSQDPGRWMAFRVYPTGLKAERRAKRYSRRYPEYQWKGVEMTSAEALALKRKPFVLRDLGVEVQPTARGAKIVRVE